MDQTNSRAAGMVHVRGYTQRREGHLVEVSDYERSAPPSHTWVAKDPQELLRRWDNTFVGGNQECVTLVQKAIPNIGLARDWREGEKINGMNDPPLEPGTAIATFQNGRYMNRTGVSHAAIFLEYGLRDRTPGIWVLDQFHGKRAGKRHISFGTPRKSAINRGESFSVIKRPE